MMVRPVILAVLTLFFLASAGAETCTGEFSDANCDKLAECEDNRCSCPAGVYGDGATCSTTHWSVRTVFQLADSTKFERERFVNTYIGLLVAGDANAAFAPGGVEAGLLQKMQDNMYITLDSSTNRTTLIALFENQNDATVARNKMFLINPQAPPNSQQLRPNIAQIFNAVSLEDGPDVFRRVTGTTDDPIEIAPTGLEVLSVFFDPSCLQTGCWTVDILFAAGKDNFNVLYIPKVDGEQDAYTQRFQDTYFPAKFPCRTFDIDYTQDTAGQADWRQTPCCIMEFVRDYRPVNFFNEWVEDPELSFLDTSICNVTDKLKHNAPTYRKSTIPDDFFEDTFENMTSYAISLGVVDEFLGTYKARLFLDDVELRTQAGKMTGFPSIEYTVDTFVGLAEFKPTEIQAFDPFTKQVNIHLEATRFMTVSVHEYVGPRLKDVCCGSDCTEEGSCPNGENVNCKMVYAPFSVDDICGTESCWCCGADCADGACPTGGKCEIRCTPEYNVTTVEEMCKPDYCCGSGCVDGKCPNGEGPDCEIVTDPLDRNMPCAPSYCCGKNCSENGRCPEDCEPPCNCRVLTHEQVINDRFPCAPQYCCGAGCEENQEDGTFTCLPNLPCEIRSVEEGKEPTCAPTFCCGEKCRDDKTCPPDAARDECWIVDSPPNPLEPCAPTYCCGEGCVDGKCPLGENARCEIITEADFLEDQTEPCALKYCCGPDCLDNPVRCRPGGFCIIKLVEADVPSSCFEKERDRKICCGPDCRPDGTCPDNSAKPDCWEPAAGESCDSDQPCDGPGCDKKCHGPDCCVGIGCNCTETDNEFACECIPGEPNCCIGSNCTTCQGPDCVNDCVDWRDPGCCIGAGCDCDDETCECDDFSQCCTGPSCATCEGPDCDSDCINAGPEDDLCCAGDDCLCECDDEGDCDCECIGDNCCLGQECDDCIGPDCDSDCADWENGNCCIGPDCDCTTGDSCACASVASDLAGTCCFGPDCATCQGPDCDTATNECTGEDCCFGPACDCGSLDPNVFGVALGPKCFCNLTFESGGGALDLGGFLNGPTSVGGGGQDQAPAGDCCIGTQCNECRGDDCDDECIGPECCYGQNCTDSCTGPGCDTDCEGNTELCCFGDCDCTESPCKCEEGGDCCIGGDCGKCTGPDCDEVCDDWTTGDCSRGDECCVVTEANPTCTASSQSDCCTGPSCTTCQGKDCECADGICECTGDHCCFGSACNCFPTDYDGLQAGTCGECKDNVNNCCKGESCNGCTGPDCEPVCTGDRCCLGAGCVTDSDCINAGDDQDRCCAGADCVCAADKCECDGDNCCLGDFCDICIGPDCDSDCDDWTVAGKCCIGDSCPDCFGPECDSDCSNAGANQDRCCAGADCVCEAESCSCDGDNCCLGDFCDICIGPDCDSDCDDWADDGKCCVGDGCSCTNTTDCDDCTSVGDCCQGPACAKCTGPDCACEDGDCECTGPECCFGDCSCANGNCTCTGGVSCCIGLQCNDCEGPGCDDICTGDNCCYGSDCEESACTGPGCDSDCGTDPTECCFGNCDCEGGSCECSGGACCIGSSCETECKGANCSSACDDWTTGECKRECTGTQDKCCEGPSCLSCVGDDCECDAVTGICECTGDSCCFGDDCKCTSTGCTCPPGSGECCIGVSCNACSGADCEEVCKGDDCCFGEECQCTDSPCTCRADSNKCCIGKECHDCTGTGCEKPECTMEGDCYVCDENSDDTCCAGEACNHCHGPGCDTPGCDTSGDCCQGESCATCTGSDCACEDGDCECTGPECCFGNCDCANGNCTCTGDSSCCIGLQCNDCEGPGCDDICKGENCCYGSDCEESCTGPGCDSDCGTNPAECCFGNCYCDDGSCECSGGACCIGGSCETECKGADCSSACDDWTTGECKRGNCTGTQDKCCEGPSCLSCVGDDCECDAVTGICECTGDSCCFGDDCQCTTSTGCTCADGSGECCIGVSCNACAGADCEEVCKGDDCCFGEECQCTDSPCTCRADSNKCCIGKECHDCTGTGCEKPECTMEGDCYVCDEDSDDTCCSGVSCNHCHGPGCDTPMECPDDSTDCCIGTDCNKCEGEGCSDPLCEMSGECYVCPDALTGDASKCCTGPECNHCKGFGCDYECTGPECCFGDDCECTERNSTHPGGCPDCPENSTSCCQGEECNTCDGDGCKNICEGPECCSGPGCSCNATSCEECAEDDPTCCKGETCNDCDCSLPDCDCDCVDDDCCMGSGCINGTCPWYEPDCCEGPNCDEECTGACCPGSQYACCYEDCEDRECTGACCGDTTGCCGTPDAEECLPPCDGACCGSNSTCCGLSDNCCTGECCDSQDACCDPDGENDECCKGSCCPGEDGSSDVCCTDPSDASCEECEGRCCTSQDPCCTDPSLPECCRDPSGCCDPDQDCCDTIASGFGEECCEGDCCDPTDDCCFATTNDTSLCCSDAEGCCDGGDGCDQIRDDPMVVDLNLRIIEVRERDDTGRNTETDPFHYLQMTVTFSSQFNAHDITGVFPDNSILIGTSSDGKRSSAAMKQACSGTNNVWDAEATQTAYEQMVTNQTSTCAPDVEMCAKVSEINDQFAVINIPLTNVITSPILPISNNAQSLQMRNVIFIESVISTLDRNSMVSRSKVSGAIPIVPGGIVIYCRNIYERVTLEEAIDVDLIIGSGNNTAELDRLRLFENLENLGNIEVNSDSIESGLMTLIIRGHEEFFNLSRTQGFSVELEDLITLHFMEPGSTSVKFDAVLALVNAETAFDVTVNRVGSRAEMTPSAALLKWCTFNPRVPTASDPLPETCIIRRDIEDRKYPIRQGGFQTAMEITPQFYAAQLPTLDGFMSNIFGSSDYTERLANRYAEAIRVKYNMLNLENNRFTRAYWINPGYEWAPSQFGSTSRFLLSQKLIMVALIGIDEGADYGIPGQANFNPVRRRLLTALPQDPGQGLQPTGVEFNNNVDNMAIIFNVEKKFMTRWTVTQEITVEAACGEESELMAKFKETLDKALAETGAKSIQGVSVNSVVVNMNGATCTGQRRANGVPAATFNTLIAFSNDKAAIDLKALAQRGLTFEAVDVSDAIAQTEIPKENSVDEEEDGNDSSSKVGLIAGICGGVGGLLVVVAGVVMYMRGKSEGEVAHLHPVVIDDLKHLPQGDQ